MSSTALDKSFLTSILCLPEHIIFRILSLCGLGELLALSAASWMTRALYRFYTRRVWSFDARFKLWFSDVRGFQNLLRRHHAIVSGSVAVQFFDRVHYPEGDLDLYIHHTAIKHISQWISSEGYSLTSTSARADIKRCFEAKNSDSYIKGFNGTSITIIVNYEKSEVFWDGIERKRRIQIIGLEVHPTRHILHEYHSTGVMNFISATFAVSIFPKQTFVHRQTAAVRDLPTARSREWITKYQDRGFDVIEKGERLSIFDSMCTSNRNVLDSQSWMIRFEIPKHLDRRRGLEEKFHSIDFKLIGTRREWTRSQQCERILQISRPVQTRIFIAGDEAIYVSEDSPVC